MGLDVRVEDATNHGRVDMAVKLRGQKSEVGSQRKIYLFEFKVVELEPEGRALEQLKRKAYHEKYLTEAGEVYLVGVEFSRLERNIVGFQWERVK